MKKTNHWSKPAAELHDLDEISDFIEKQLKSMRISGSTLHDLLVATTEAVTNILFHGYQNSPGFLEIRIDLDSDNVLTIRLRDQAFNFDPTQQPPPDTMVPLEKRDLGGLGVHLIRQLTDQVIHTPMDPRGNELILKKKL